MSQKDQEALEELKKFWHFLKGARVIDNEFLILEGKTKFLGEKGGFSSLYIRKCYRDLKVTVFDKKVDKLRITGNLGIGKTFFGYYLLYLLALRNETIVYDNYHIGVPIVFDGKEAFYSINIRGYLHDSDVWYIVDGKEPKDVEAKTILICSPRKFHYNEFVKYDGVVELRFMPVWRWKEISACRKFFYNDVVLKKTAKECFLKWGGIPRYVLQRANQIDHQASLDTTIQNCKIDIFDYVGESREKDSLSHRLVHSCPNLPINYKESVKESYNVDYYDSLYDQSVLDLYFPQLKPDKYGKEPYTTTTLKFASVYVMEKVTSNLKIKIRERMCEKIEAGISNSLLGNSFEYMAHKILRKGGCFDVRSLESNVDDPKPYTSVTLSPQDKLLSFSNTGIDSIKDGKYYQPTDPNFPSIDAIIAPNHVFQMTIVKKHPIKMSGLKRLCEKLGGESGNNKIFFYFVMPEELYKSGFKIQNFANSKGKVAKIIPDWIQKRIFQYALKIKLDSFE